MSNEKVRKEEQIIISIRMIVNMLLVKMTESQLWADPIATKNMDKKFDFLKPSIYRAIIWRNITLIVKVILTNIFDYDPHK